MKSQGVTKCASLGYASSPSSGLAAEGFVKSCEAAGLKSGYLNTQFPFGSTNVGPIALAMKNAGVDGLFLPTDTITDPNREETAHNTTRHRHDRTGDSVIHGSSGGGW